ncbi:hypothetical protein GCM10027059_30360 [Myceligenerans halotolerans]
MDDDGYIDPESRDGYIDPESRPAGVTNLIDLAYCIDGSYCTLLDDGGTATNIGIALLVAVALNICGIVLSYKSLVGIIEFSIGRSIRGKFALAFCAVAVALLWFHLWLTYALTEVQGQSIFAWMFTGPLFTLVLMIGVGLSIISVGYVVNTIMAMRRMPGKPGPEENMVLAFSEVRWQWGLLIAFVLAVLIGWHVLYESVPEVAAGPFGQGPLWLQHALDVWTLEIPVTILWGLATLLGSIPGIVGFGVLGILSLILPQQKVSPDGEATGIASEIAKATTVQLMGLVVSVCIAIIVGLILVIIVVGVIGVVGAVLVVYMAYLMAAILAAAMVSAFTKK